MAERLLLLGATGRLGGALLDAAAPCWNTSAPGRARFDLEHADPSACDELLGAHQPTVVINSAAMAWVDACEAEPQRAEAVNARAPGLLARACAGAGVPLLHISTDYVFGDTARCGASPYAEDSPIGPLQVYGRTKLGGERAALAAGATVARVSWLFRGLRGSFHRYVLDQVARGGQVSVLAEQRSRPSDMDDVARWLLEVSRRLSSGGAAPPVLHVGGGPAATRGEWARSLLDALGHHELRVVAQRGEAAGAMATRPLDSSLDIERTTLWSRSVGIEPVRDWRDAIAGLSSVSS